METAGELDFPARIDVIGSLPRALVPGLPTGERPPREMLIRAARLRAAGRDWDSIAADFQIDVRRAANWLFYFPKAWDALYARAEKESLDYAAARATQELLAAVGSPDPAEAEHAARALLAQRARMLPRLRPPDNRDRTGRVRYPPRPEPERRVPSTTSTPSERPLMRRLRRGKFSRLGGVSRGSSLTSAPLEAMRPASSSFSGG